MKKFLALVLALVLILSCFAIAEETTSDSVIYAKVKSKQNGKTPLYKLPGEYRPIITNVSNGTQIIVLFEGTVWHKVKLNNTETEGWMKADEVAITTRGLSALNLGSTINGAKTVRSNNGYGQLYWGPDTYYDVMDDLPNGRYVWVFETLGNWCRVLLEDGRIGYMQLNQLTGSSLIKEWPAGLYGYVQVSGDSANFRSDSNYNSKVLGQCYSGDVVEIIGEYNYFLKVFDTKRNREGFLSVDIISPEGLNRIAIPTEIYYDDPSRYQADVLWNGTVGQTVKILATDGYVSRIEYDDVTGYIYDFALAY